MKCPFCGSLDDKVIDSRPLEEASIIRRRRECLACQKRFTTYERLEEVPLMVIKSDNRREPFSREKLRAGLLRSCDKRPISIDKIEKIISEIEYEMHNYYIMEVHSSSIGQKVLKRLKELDKGIQSAGGGSNTYHKKGFSMNGTLVSDGGTTLATAR